MHVLHLLLPSVIPGGWADSALGTFEGAGEINAERLIGPCCLFAHRSGPAARGGEATARCLPALPCCFPAEPGSGHSGRER